MTIFEIIQAGHEWVRRENWDLGYSWKDPKFMQIVSEKDLKADDWIGD